MKRGITAFAAACLALIFPIIATAQTPTRERAMQAPISELSREMLSALAPQLVEMSRPDFTGMMGPDAPLTGLRFATRARSAGNPGMCVATVLYIQPDATDYSPVTAWEVYRVVGPTAPLPDMWNEDYDAWLKARCANTGSVISERMGDFESTTFFRVDGDETNDAWIGARALELAIEEARQGRMTVECVNEPANIDEYNSALCPDQPASAFAQLRLGRLRSIDFGACRHDPVKRCLVANLLRGSSGNVELLWRVTLEVVVREGRDGDRDVDVPTWARMVTDYVVYD